MVEKRRGIHGDPEQQPLPYSNVAHLLGIAAMDSRATIDPDAPVVVPQIDTSLRTELSDKNGETIRQSFDRKCRGVHQFLRKQPVSPEAKGLLENVYIIASNMAGATHPESTIPDQLVRYVTNIASSDTFDMQRAGAEYAGLFLGGTRIKDFDMVDLMFAGRTADLFFYQTLSNMPPGKIGPHSERIRDFQHAYRSAVVHALPAHQLIGEATLSLEEIYRKSLHHQEGMPNADTSDDILRYQLLVRDRLSVAELISQGGIWSSKQSRGESVYARPSKQGELEQLDTKAADTIERLHLLKAYGVTPFEVSARQTQLPWDIAVMPPLEDALVEEPRYAEGAVADFVLLPGNEQRDDILLREAGPLRGRATKLRIGDSQVAMRFRLHDDGSISYGLHYHNTPGPYGEQTFDEFYAKPAFKLLRGLFISLAFDAVVPADVVDGRTVRGGTGQALLENPKDPMARRLTKLLLQRGRALRQANVGPENQRPVGWERPAVSVGVRGCQPKLPTGAHPRPSAEEEAREYYESMGLRFTGLKEGHTFRRPYTQVRGTLGEPEPITYRRAYFRQDSQTAAFLKNRR